MDTRGAPKSRRPWDFADPRKAIGGHRFRKPAPTVKRCAATRASKPIAASRRALLGAAAAVSRLRSLDPAAVLIVGLFVKLLQRIDHIVEPDDPIRSRHLSQSRHGFDGTQMAERP